MMGGGRPGPVPDRRTRSARPWVTTEPPSSATSRCAMRATVHFRKCGRMSLAIRCAFRYGPVFAGLRMYGLTPSNQQVLGVLRERGLHMGREGRRGGDAQRVDVPPQGDVGCSASPPTAASDASSAQGLGTERPRSTEPASMVQHPILTPHDGGGDDYDGAALAEEIFDLLRSRLPRLASEDPVRALVQPLLPALGEALGHPRLLLVEQRLAGS
jgi:hypothetical protein